jgi:uncharacterized peroxidase-related enzyme
MPHFPSVKKNERLSTVFGKFNTGIEKPLLQFHEALMRSKDSPFTVAERELLAAYVSGVMNDCGYCVNIHRLVAQEFGVEEGLLERLLEDIDSPGIDEKMKPVFNYVKKLTLDPYKMVPGDTEAVFNAGWDERALYDALLICCTWNFMNRFVEGIGFEVEYDQYLESASMLKKGYAPIIEKFNLK